MAVPSKYQRLLAAAQRFNSFNHFVDLIEVGLFFLISIAVANKLLPKKVLDYELFDLSWRTIGVCTFIFLVIFFTQLSKLNRQRELSEFEKEATLKAFKRNKSRKK